ncbi:Uncharacterized protein OBRU01_18676 [Operophtera brumata]|uniref:Nuclease HARBI1 n=1 Tax=Operophtera brumata TaxID=104452 RepID=A0A0L7KZ41_OPEBR|nr:Uncharacterized protein OBRU01_18676 [Operophtera brumata]
MEHLRTMIEDHPTAMSKNTIYRDVRGGLEKGIIPSIIMMTMTLSNFSISPINQLLATLRFYATNCTQTSIGDFCGLSTPTANKIVHRVSAAIATLHIDYINFPETHQEIRKEQDEFYKIALDGGYASKSYAMTPLENPRTPAEQLYNESQIRTRKPVERSYGVWKRRFPVLAFGMRVKLDKALVVIMATAVYFITCYAGVENKFHQMTQNYNYQLHGMKF